LRVRAWIRHVPHERRRVGLRRAVGEHLLDRALAPVLRALDQLHLVLRAQVRRQQPHGRQVEFARANAVEQCRVRARGARGGDALVGAPLGEAQGVRAVREHRRVALTQVELAGVDLAQVREQIRLDGARPKGERTQRAKEILIGENSNR
jgi:hypothetical protein